MTEAKVIKEFASNVMALAKQASAMADYTINLRTLQKEASAKKEAEALNEQKLAKAANAVAQLYGDRAAVTPDKLVQIWSGNHNTIVDSLTKVASDLCSKHAEKAVAEKFVSVKKTATARNSAASVQSGDMCNDAFDAAFGRR